jgi:hypothetical protein
MIENREPVLVKKKRLITSMGKPVKQRPAKQINISHTNKLLNFSM